MIITNSIINQGASINGGWSLKQIKLLGAKRFKKGWKYKVIGKDIPKSRINEFLELKNKHLGELEPIINDTNRHIWQQKILKQNPWLNLECFGSELKELALLFDDEQHLQSITAKDYSKGLIK